MPSMIELAFEEMETVQAPIRSGRGRQAKRWEDVFSSLRDNPKVTIRVSADLIAKVAAQDPTFNDVTVEAHGQDRVNYETDKKHVQSLAQQISRRLSAVDPDDVWNVVTGISPSDSNLYGLYVRYDGRKPVEATEDDTTEAATPSAA